MDLLRRVATAGRPVLAVSVMARTKSNRCQSSYDAEGLSLASFRESSELEYGADSASALAPDADAPELVTTRRPKHRYGEPLDIPLGAERRLQRFTPTDPTPASVC